MSYFKWSDFDKAAEKGPVSFGVKLLLAACLLGTLLGGLGYVAGWFSETAQVAQEQFGPRAVLKKYEHFKDQAAALDAKVATIESYDRSLKQMKTDMVDANGKTIPMAQWPLDQRESYNQRATEIRGLKASYNTLAAEYNADMSKVNYRFANQGELPQGADKPLPREYKPYIVD